MLHVLGWPWRLAWAAWLVPAPLRDPLYRWVARNRLPLVRAQRGLPDAVARRRGAISGLRLRRRMRQPNLGPQERKRRPRGALHSAKRVIACSALINDPPAFARSHRPEVASSRSPLAAWASGDFFGGDAGAGQPGVGGQVAGLGADEAWTSTPFPGAWRRVRRWRGRQPVQRRPGRGCGPGGVGLGLSRAVPAVARRRGHGDAR